MFSDVEMLSKFDIEFIINSYSTQIRKCESGTHTCQLYPGVWCGTEGGQLDLQEIYNAIGGRGGLWGCRKHLIQSFIVGLIVYNLMDIGWSYCVRGPQCWNGPVARLCGIKEICCVCIKSTRIVFIVIMILMF